jgi:steroid delta-isomerase-like uncharacterized protein
MRLAIPSIGAERTPGSLQPDNHEAVMRQFVEVIINNGDYSALNDLVHADYVYRAPGQEMRGAEEIQALFETYRSAFPDLHVLMNDLIATDDRVAIAFTLTGTHDGALMGLEATGKRVKVNGTIFSRFEGGKIIEEWEILDQLSLFEQLGMACFPA